MDGFAELIERKRQGSLKVYLGYAAGVGKTAYWLYPCIEYACASGMSFLSTDTKGDVMRNYGTVAKEYGYQVSVIDLRIEFFLCVLSLLLPSSKLCLNVRRVDTVKTF
mgnify:CR=1 FL=1